MILSGTHNAQVENANRGYRWLWSGNQSHQNVAAPPQIQQKIVPRDQPWHPTDNIRLLSWDNQHQNVASPPQIQKLTVPPWQPEHPLPYFVSSKVGLNVNVAPPPQIQQRTAGQELPNHPLPTSWSGNQTHTNVRPAIVDRVFLEQRTQPLDHFLLSIEYSPGIPGPNVALEPQIGKSSTRQEFPWHPLSTEWSGNQTHTNVAALPQIQSTFTRQKFLERVLSQVGPSVLAAPSAPMQRVVLPQEQAFLFISALRVSVQGPNVASSPQVTGYAFTTRELPGHSLPFSWSGAPPTPEINLPERRSTVIGQQLPDHPLPKSWSGVRPNNTAALPQIATFAFVIQQIPDLGRVNVIPGPQPQTLVNLPGLIVDQKLPGHPLPVTLMGEAEVIPPEARAVSVVQYYPDHSLPKFWSGNPPTPEIILPERRTANVKQELPGHPLPQARAGVSGPNVRSPETEVVFVIQEPIRQQFLTASSGIQIPNVKRPVADFVSLRQEIDKSPSFALLPVSIGAAFVPIYEVILTQLSPPERLRSSFETGLLDQIRYGIGKAVLSQELPGIPPTNFVSRPISIPPVIIEGSLRQLKLLQELPWHPLPYIAPAGSGFIEFIWPEPQRRWVRQTPNWIYSLNSPNWLYVLVADPGSSLMPNVGSLPAIAPNQIQTIAVDFGRWLLPLGVTLTGTPTVNVTLDFGSDPNPQARVVRSPVIGTVAQLSGGTAVPNTAVIFQIGGCLPSNIYVFEIVCLRTDSDVAEAWTTCACISPH